MKQEAYVSLLRSLFENDGLRIWLRAFKSLSFSQFGEDLFYALSFKIPRQGFYVDVGAAYPLKNSNTYRLYLKGWRGVTIEPNSRFASAHVRLRPRDVHVNAGVSDQVGELDYYCFDVADFNTFDRETAAAVSLKHALPCKTTKVKVETLTAILDSQCVPKNIDLMSIDCEGFDLKVLRSLDWNRYFADVILIEDHAPDVSGAMHSDIATFLASKTYLLVGRIKYTSVFVRRCAVQRLS